MTFVDPRASLDPQNLASPWIESFPLGHVWNTRIKISELAAANRMHEDMSDAQTLPQRCGIFSRP